jgi:hypothetical protein
VTHGVAGDAPFRVRALSVVPDDELIRQLEHAQESFTLEWLRGVMATPHNTHRLELRRFGGIAAPAAPGTPELDFMNRVGLIVPSDAVLVPEIIDWYRSLGVRPWFEVAPMSESALVTEALARAGARHEYFHNVVAATIERGEGAGGAAPTAMAPWREGVTVETIGPANVDTFSATLLSGHGVAPELRPVAIVEHRHWAEVPTWRLLLARVGGEPAGAAVLAIDGTLALLANAATVETLRGRGVQSSLIAARLRMASSTGCQTVCSGVVWGSASHRNLRRAGLGTVYTKAVWRLGPR